VLLHPITGWPTAVPVWLVVVDAAEEPHSHKWRVVGDNICIRCGKPVTAADLDTAVSRRRICDSSLCSAQALPVEERPSF
jgi:hypothetical protein